MNLNKLKKAILFVDVFVALFVVTFMLTTKNFTQIFWAIVPEKSLAGAETMGFNFVASPEETKTKAGETVTLTLSVADINVGENGINSIVGFLDYNESLFETVEFQGINSGNQSNGNANNSILNGWNIEVNRIQGHELYGKFCIYTLQEGVEENQDVVKITMKLKSDLTPQTTEVNFTKLVSSDGVYEIAEEDSTAVIIIEDAEDDGNQGSEGDGNQGSEGDGNQGSEGNGSQGTEGDGNQGSEGDGGQGTEGDGNQGSEGNTNQGSSGNQNSNNNQNVTGSGNSNDQSNSPQTGDTKILIVVAILILVIIVNLLIFCKKSKIKIIVTVVTIIVGILSFVIVSNAQNTQNNAQPLTVNDKINKISFQENLLNTDKVLVKDSTISAATPEMTVEDFLNIFNSQIKVTDNGIQVISGELKTGMNVSLLNPTSADIDKDTIYEVVVAGDINKDGISNQIELTKIIRNIINNQKWQLNDIEKLAADMNIDRKINNEDIEASVNYIVYGNYFKYTETVQEDIRNVDAPTIEAVQGNFNEEVNCYIDDVIIRITETDKNASKTRYKIEDENGNSITISELANNSTGDNSSTQYTGLAKFVEIERTNKDENGNVIREILIKKDGIYKISALTDGELGNRSDVSYKVIVKGKSDKKYTVTYDYATNGGVSSIDSQIITEDVDVTYNTPVDLSKQGTKQYYKFIGWNTDATATTAFSTFTMGIQNETLYAIYERDIEIELDPTTISMEYGNTQTITATTKNTGNIIWSSSDESVATVSDIGVVTAKKVGTVTITATASTDSTVTATCQVTVTPKTLTISASADDKEYDGTTNVVNGQILVNGILNADDVLVSGDFTYEDANVGTDKKVNVTNITLSGVDANNYKISETTLTTTSNILAKGAENQDIQASLDNTQVTYNGKEQKPTVAITDNLTTLIEGTHYDVEYKDNINAGTATVKVTLKGNYSGTKELSFEIEKAKLTATYAGETIEFGQTPLFKVTVDGFVNNETIDTAEEYTAPTVAFTNLQQGTYTLTPQGGSAKNYDFNYVSGLLVINAKLNVDIQLAQTQFIYDGTVKEPAVIVKDGNTTLVEGTDYDVVYSDNINAGTGTATVTLKGNYAGTAVKTFTIAQAQGTGSVSIEGWIYGENAKTPVANSNTNTQVTYQYTGTTNGGVSYSSSVAPTQAGNYTVTATFDANNNYKGFTATADFVVDRKELTATYVSEEINYGDNPELKVEVTGFVNGETVETATGFTMPVVVNTNTEPGEYELTPEGGTATNYTFKYVKGILKINLPTFTITYELNDGELEQGNENPNEYTQKSEDITLNNPTKSGYEFLGWTLTKLDGVAQGSSTPSTTVTIAKGSKGNREYTANWILVAPTVEITAENLEVNLFENQTTTFTATVENASNPTYQWYYGENAIEGATASTYSISTTDMNSNNYKGGEYSVAVTNNETISTLAGTETNPTTTVSKELIQEVNYSEVSSAEQMKNFAIRVNNQGIMFEGDTIKQSAETIDLSSVCSQSLGSWTPIGSDANMFKGIFDGDGNEVTNLYINEEEGMLGLFGVTKDSTIKNVTVSGFIKGTGVTWKTVAGGIVARNISGTVENCTNNVNIEAISRAGGIAGKSEEDSVITNCTNNGTITSDTTKTIEETVDGVTQTVVASRWIGGIAGVGQGVISNCTNTADIVGNRAGGISGISNNGTTSILNCINDGNITGNQNGGITYTFKGLTEDYKISNCANTGNLIVKDTDNETNLYGAGIANANDGLIERCYNTGDIEVISANYNGASIVGGIFAADGKGSIVRKCYNEGDITAECNHDGDSIHAMCSAGGIAGYIRRNTFIEDCYNRGDITANKLQGSNTNSAGGIVGYISFVELNEVTPGELLPEGQVNTDVNEINSHMIKDCYSTGDIKGTNKGGNSYVGGVLGQYHATSRDINEIVSNTYYLNTSTDTGIDLNGVNTTSIAISKESSEMKEDVFVTLLGDDTWELVAGVNGDYPVFGWQYSTFNISYDLAGGELLEGVTNPKNYAESSADIKLNNPKREMYVFTGWTGSNGTTPELTVTIPKGSTGNKTYTANWTEAYYYNETSDTYYAKLADATSSSATGSQINVVKNANETARATVSSNKELTLNLNNYTVSYTGTADTFRLYNEGTLNIIGSGKITSTEGYTLRNSGTMNIRLEDDGLVESIGNEITDRAIQNSGTGVLNIYSGTIRTDVTNTVVENAQTYAIVGNTGTTINLYGGKIDATATHPYQSGVISEGTVNVRGGTIEANLRGITIKNAGNLNITKGSINSLVDGNAIFFASTGTLSITGTEKVDIISNNANGIRNSAEDGGNGTIIINNPNATISGNSGIYMEIGNVDVIAGTVIGKTNYGIGSDSIGSITIGKDDSTVSQVTPVITGARYGVNRSAGTLSFYDGLMKGATAAFSGEVADKPDDYIVDIKTEDEIKVAYLRFLEEYTISYDANGGTGAPEAQTKIEGTDLTLSSTIPTREGYVFVGWDTSKTATTAEYKSGEIYTEDVSVVLYAQWTANTYTVNYYNGTTLLGTSAHTYNTPKELTKMSTLGGSNSGYTFYGWTTSTTATERTYTDGQSVNNLTTIDVGTVNLYAIWTRPVTFRSGISSTTTDQQVIQYYNPKGAKSSVTTPSIAALSGYTTEGWSPWTDARAPEVAAGGVATSGASIYYAVYSTDINFIHGIGKAKTTTVKRYRNSNNSIGSIVTPTPDTITSFTTLGWRNDTTVGASENAVGETIASPSTTYYAVYSRTITLKYNANGGTGTVANQTKTQYYNSNGGITTISFTLSANAFINGSLNFTKWAAGSATGTQYAAGVIYKFSPEVSSTTVTQTMYAIWVESTTITFSAGYTNVGGGGGTTPGASGGGGSTARVPKGYTVYYELNANQAGGTGGSGTSYIKFDGTIIDEITATYQYTPKSSSGSFITDTDGVLEIAGSGGGPTLGETGGQAEGTANAYATVIKILDPYGKECILE